MAVEGAPMPEWVLQGRYRPHRVIGRGALAEVWRATDLLLGREVAVKLFLHRPAGPGDATVGDQSVEGEISALAQLSHPNVVPLYDVGYFQGEPFVVMPLIEGPSLAHYLAVHGRLPLRRVASLGAGLAAGLACVHQHRIVHRDVKPANILLGEDDAPLLADFGVAVPVSAEPITATGNTVGTAFYMAPEQVRGERIGPAADVYALGLVLLECLTGQREYEGRPLDAAVARLSRPPVVPAELPDKWVALLKSMVSIDPAHRPNAGAVAEQCAVLAAEAEAAEGQPAGFLDSLFPASDVEDALAATTHRPPRKTVTTTRARHRMRTSLGPRHRRSAVVVAAVTSLIVVTVSLGVIRSGSTPNPAADSASKPPSSTGQAVLDAAKDSVADSQPAQVDESVAPAQSQVPPAAEQPAAAAAATPRQPATAEPAPAPAASQPPGNGVVASSATEPADVGQAHPPPSKEKVKNDHGKRMGKGNAQKLRESNASEGASANGNGKGKSQGKNKH
jgi:eukaryotic-like serine/threonine-protein kinase